METLIQFCQSLIDNKEIIVNGIKSLGTILLALIGLASIIIQAIPTLKASNKALPLVKFIGKYIALNKTVRREDNEESTKSKKKKRKNKCF